MRGLAALARLTLEQQRQQLQRATDACRLGSPDLEAELSAGSMAGLLDGGGSAWLASPEVLQPELAASSCSPGMRGFWEDGGGAAHVESAVAPWCGLEGLSTCSAGSQAPSDGLRTAAWYHEDQPQPPTLPARPHLEAADARSVGAYSSGTTGALAQHETVAGASNSVAAATAQAGAASDDEAGWQFASPATAAAYAQLRQRHQAAARRRELEKQMKDPLQRLHRFQGRSATLPACPGGNSSTGRTGVAASVPGCKGAGSRCSSPEQWSLPALRSPRSVQLDTCVPIACAGPAGSSGSSGGSTPAAQGKPRHGTFRRTSRPSIHILTFAPA